MTQQQKEPKRSIEYLPVDELKVATRNPKKHSTDIPVSIERFGFTEPIVVDERTQRLVAGHGRRAALLSMRAAGNSAPNGITVDKNGQWLVPVIRGWASKDDAEAEAYLLASNRLAEIGGWDEASLAEMLKELQTGDALLGVGFDDLELQRLFDASAESDPKGVEFKEFDESAAEGVTMIACPFCHQSFPK